MSASRQLNVSNSPSYTRDTGKMLHFPRMAMMALAAILCAMIAKTMFDKVRRDAQVSTNLGRVAQILLAVEYALENQEGCVFDPAEEAEWKILSSKFITWDRSSRTNEIAPIFFPDKLEQDVSDIIAVCVSPVINGRQCCDNDYAVICSEIAELQVSSCDSSVVSLSVLVSRCAARRDEGIFEERLIVGYPGKAPHVTTVGKFIAMLSQSNGSATGKNRIP